MSKAYICNLCVRLELVQGLLDKVLKEDVEERKKGEEIFRSMIVQERRARQDPSERLMARFDEEAKRRKEGKRNRHAQPIQAAQNQRVDQHKPKS